MADFRKWFYAFASVGFLTALTVPASAQSPNINCSVNQAPNTQVRAEGYTELVGDIVLTCTGGKATPADTVVPSVNFTIQLNTNITSRITATPFDEALLLIDEPNSSVNTAPLLNCGSSGAPFAAGIPGVCTVTSDGNPADTYNGTTNPNVFQGQLGSQFSTIQFAGVPIDPPGTGGTRTFRFTNIRADAEFVGVGASSFVPSPIIATVSLSGNASVTLTNPTITVASVQKGLLTPGSSKTPANAFTSVLTYVQCNATNASVKAGDAATSTAVATAPAMRFQEGYFSAWKARNVSETTAGGAPNAAPTGVYNSGLNNSPDLSQDVPGTNYNTETGFLSAAFNSTTTGIAKAGKADQGTRLALTLQNVPQGSSVFVPSILYLHPQSDNADASVSSTNASGVMVLVTTDANGAGTYTPVSSGTSSVLEPAGSNGLVVYEVLYANPLIAEQVDVPVVVSFTPNLASTAAPGGLPVTGTIATASGGFAPFYVGTQAARQPSSTLPIPRFVGGNPPLNLFEVNKCACDLLFPYVASVAGFDTGLAIANTSADPGSAAGFISTGQQSGTVTFYYFGQGANNANAPASQTSAVVPAGQVLTYVLSNGGGAIGSGPNGLDNRAAGFSGYIIAQTQFQYCHGFAFISALGQGATGNGVSEGYLGIVLDNGNGILPRTTQAAENLGQ